MTTSLRATLAAALSSLVVLSGACATAGDGPAPKPKFAPRPPE